MVADKLERLRRACEQKIHRIDRLEEIFEKNKLSISKKLITDIPDYFVTSLELRATQLQIQLGM